MYKRQILREAKRFANEIIYGEIDVDRLESERRRISTWQPESKEEYTQIYFHVKEEQTPLSRFFDPSPFVPDDKNDRDRRCDEILTIQAMGLKKRLDHTGCKAAVLGISGGLDSTLALLVTARALTCAV